MDAFNQCSSVGVQPGPAEMKEAAPAGKLYLSHVVLTGELFIK